MLQALDDMFDDSQALLAHSFANVLVPLAGGISSIVAERDAWNYVGYELPLVLLFQLVWSDMQTLLSNI